MRPFILLSLGFGLFFQVPPSAFADELLNRVVENVRSYDQTLPSITAEEAISSEMRHGVYTSRAEAKAVMRVFKAGDDQYLKEVRTFSTVNGKIVPQGARPPEMPFVMQGSFSGFADLFFSQKNFPCYVMTRLSGAAADGTVSYSISINPQAEAHCNMKGLTLTGLVRIDPQTAHIVHMERSMPVPPAGSSHWVSLEKIDYAPAMIGDQTFWLPTVLTAEYDKGKGHFSARYSSYHRFTASVTVVPATAVE